MDLLSAQKNTHDYVVYSFKKYLPAGGRSETLYQSGWFEEMYTFNRNIYGKSIPIQVYVHMDLFEHGFNAAGEQLLSIIGQMGFRVPYKKEIWEDEKIQPLSFEIKPDDVYLDCLNFSYKGSHGNTAENGLIAFRQNTGLTIGQFCADTMANLNGMYQYIIGKYNGLCN